MNALNKRYLQRCLVLAAAMLALSGPVRAVEPAEALELAVEAATMQSEVEDWQRLLINGSNPLPENFAVELATLENGMKADKRICADLSAMLRDCRAAGLKPKICSAYRDAATQTRLHKNKIARLRAAGLGREEAEREAARWVAVPGTSEHQTGLALDLVSANYQYLNEKQAETPEQQWLMAHSWEYGFILRYPTDKSEITGIGYEPWHYRYVGRPLAEALHESGLCLEEYLAMPAAVTARVKEKPEIPASPFIPLNSYLTTVKSCVMTIS